MAMVILSEKTIGDLCKEIIYWENGMVYRNILNIYDVNNIEVLDPVKLPNYELTPDDIKKITNII